MACSKQKKCLKKPQICENNILHKAETAASTGYNMTSFMAFLYAMPPVRGCICSNCTSEDHLKLIIEGVAARDNPVYQLHFTNVPKTFSFLVLIL